jgi:hypothetical protein
VPGTGSARRAGPLCRPVVKSAGFELVPNGEPVRVGALLLESLQYTTGLHTGVRTRTRPLRPSSCRQTAEVAVAA